jgi:hypothetical protein
MLFLRCASRPVISSNHEQELAFPKPPSRPVEEFGSPIRVIEKVTVPLTMTVTVQVSLRQYGIETLRRRFLAAAMFTQNFDEVILPLKSHVLSTPDRNG